MSALNDLKKNMFFELLNLAGRVYVVVRFSPDVDLGRRTFTPEEQKSGLTLVFTTRMAIQWDSVGLSTTLTFGAQPCRCFIPSHDMIAIYSPDLQVQLTASPDEALSRKPCCTDASCRDSAPSQKTAGKKRGTLIEVDFAKKLREKKEPFDKEDA